MSGNGASKTQDKTDKTVNITGHEGDGHVGEVATVGVKLAKGRTMEEVGNRDLNITGKKGGSADKVKAVGLQFD